jgi:hypothetical protein
VAGPEVGEPFDLGQVIRISHCANGPDAQSAVVGYKW